MVWFVIFIVAVSVVVNLIVCIYVCHVALGVLNEELMDYSAEVKTLSGQLKMLESYVTALRNRVWHIENGKKDEEGVE